MSIACLHFNVNSHRNAGSFDPIRLRFTTFAVLHRSRCLKEQTSLPFLIGVISVINFVRLSHRQSSPCSEQNSVFDSSHLFSVCCRDWIKSLSKVMRVGPKRKKDSFSMKSHPCAATVIFVDCCPAIRELADRACYVWKHQMRMTDGDSCRIGSIIRLRDCWQVEQLAHHIAYLLF